MAAKETLIWHHVLYPHEFAPANFPVNTLKQVKVKNKKICIAATPNGFFALDDACPHAGGSLSLGRLDSKENVICPLHRYGFNLKTGKNANGTGACTGAYKTEIREDGLYIALPKRNWWPW